MSVALATNVTNEPAFVPVCFHCDATIPATFNANVRIFGRDEAMCCVGCAAVASAIVDAGLADFYLKRTAGARTGQKWQPPGSSREFDLPGVHERYTKSAGRGEESASLYLDGITCAACLWLAEKTLSRISGVTAVSVNYAMHQADVRWNCNDQQLSSIVSALAHVGIRATPMDAPESAATDATASRRALVRLGVAFLGMMQVMMFTVPRYLADPGDVSADAAKLMDWASFVLTLPVVFFSAADIFRSALRGVFARQINMDVPVAIAIAATFLSSSVVMLRGEGAVYFDSISMFVFLLLAARYWELRARNQARALVRRLANAVPSVALRLNGYPNNRDVERVANTALLADEHVLVEAGAIIPADGEVVEGSSTVDEAILTGESRPVEKRRHMFVCGGTVNGASSLVLRVTAAGRATTISAIARLAQQALQTRPQMAMLSDRYARYIAPLTLLVAVAAASMWVFIDATKSFSVAIAVLAVTCPCALALAAPAAFAVTTRRLVGRGLLISRAHVVETLPTITDVVFDKTGTLTAGEMIISGVETEADVSVERAIAIASALELGAAHPVARALARMENSNSVHVVAEDIRLLEGQGVLGKIDGVEYRFGHAALACGEESPDAANDAFVLGASGRRIAVFHINDPLRVDAKSAVAALTAAGLKVHVLSGDTPDRVHAVAEAVGVPDGNVLSRQSPASKLAFIKALRNNGARVLMIGDGVNDAPVLAGADVSIAIGDTAADLPKLAADAVLMSPSLSIVAFAIRQAGRVKRISRQNFVWAIVYNLGAVPLAAANVITPATAAIGMAVSSLMVIANSMRLARG